MRLFMLWCLVLGLLASPAVAQQTTEQVLVDVDFNDQAVGEAPKTGPPGDERPNKRPVRLRTSGLNQVEVVESLGGLEDQPLRMEKREATPYTPGVWFVNRHDTVPAGDSVRVAWDAVITEFQAGDKWPGFETLLTMNLWNNSGQQFFSMQMVVNEELSGGFYRTNVDNRKHSAWRLGEPVRLAVEVDLASGRYRLLRDGEVMTEGQSDKLVSQMVRIVEIRDGTAYGTYGGVFTAAIDNVKVTRGITVGAEAGDENE